MSVRIIIDSASDFTKERADQLNLDFMPLKTIFGDTAVVITLSPKLSGTYQSANIALDGFEDCITVVDSENVCAGEQILILYACHLREQGLSAKEIAHALDVKKKDICVVALLDTLEYLKKGGRISATAAFAGTLLSIKPVIAIENGEVVVLGKEIRKNCRTRPLAQR